MKKPSKDVLILICLFVILTVVAFMFGSRDSSDSEPDTSPQKSTYSSKRGGMRALYDTLDKLDYNVKRHLSPLTQPPADGVLFIISPVAPIENNEWDSLMKWVGRGNTLVICRNMSMPIMFDEEEVTEISKPVIPSFLSRNADIVKYYGISELDELVLNNNDEFPNFKSSNAKKLLNKNNKSVNVVESKSIPLVPLYGKRSKTLIAYGKVKNGEVIVLANSWILCNQGINKADNFVVALNAINHRGDKKNITVSFDEYHQGYNMDIGIMSLIGKNAKFGLLVIVIAFIVYVFAVSRRFGQPVELRESGRQRGEYLSSMSSLIKRAKATDIVRRELGRKFLEDITHRLGLPKTASLSEIVSSAKNQAPNLASDIEALVKAASGMDGQNNSENDLFMLSQKWHKIRKELKI